MEKDGTFDKLPKKEVVKIRKEYEKLNSYFAGLREMKKIPQAMIIVDPKKELNAINEAHKLGIPVFGIVDTNCDPDLVDYVIPGNDDAIRAVKIVLGVLTNAICEATGKPLDEYVTEEDKVKTQAKEVVKETKELVKEVKKAALNKVEEEKPKVEKKVKEVKEKIEEKVKEVKEEAEKQVKKAVKEVKKEAEPKVKEAKKTAESVEKQVEDLTKKTVAELKEMAKNLKIAGYSKLKKDELIAALKK